MLVVTVLATGGLVMLAGQQPPAGVFTAAQAAAGRTAYQTNCASCHLADLKGSGDAAQLAGSEFMDAWGRRTPRELLSFIQLTMPPTRPGALSQEEYLGIAAFILQSNGAAAGGQALTPSVDVAINSIARGGKLNGRADALHLRWPLPHRRDAARLPPRKPPAADADGPRAHPPASPSMGK